MRLQLLMCLLMVAVTGNAAAADGARPIDVEIFTINRQVDSNRFVEKAVRTNTAEGHYVVEFMTSGGPSRERWTVTFENHPSFDYVQHVQVNAEWRYSMTYSGASNNPQISIAVPNLSAHLYLLVGCANTELTLFKALAVQVATERAIVAAVFDAIPTNDLQDPPPNCHLNCIQTWTLPYCDPAEPGNWGQAIACCVASKKMMYCLRMCECQRALGDQARAECENKAFEQQITDIQRCIDGNVPEILAACP